MKLTLFLFLILFVFSSFARCDLSYSAFRTLDGTQSLKELKKVKMGSYNVLNLEYSPGKYVKNSKTGEKEFIPKGITKDPKATQEIADIMLSENLDIIVLQEVEGKQAIDLFNKNFLADQYEVFIMPGNDTRGIDIAFLVKKDLPFKIKMTSNREATWISHHSKKVEKIFSRDLPTLHFWRKSASGSDPPDFAVMGNHLKSQRDRASDPKSVIMRTAQVDEIVQNIKNYDETFPDMPVFLAGDFNANIHEGVEFKSLFKDGLMKDSFDLSTTKLTAEERITHTFHPRGAETKNSQLDAVLANKSGSSLISKAEVYRYKNTDGSIKSLPKTYDERELNPSDHFPVIVEIDLSKLGAI